MTRGDVGTGGSGVGFRESGREGEGGGRENGLALVKVGEMRGRRRAGTPGRRNMGRSPGSYWGERVRVGWVLHHGVAQTLYHWLSQQNPIHGVQKF